MADLYRDAGEGELAATFQVGDHTTRTAILHKVRYRTIPDSLLKVALARGEPEVLWALSQRHDLPCWALDTLIDSGITLVHRTLASSVRLTSEQP